MNEEFFVGGGELGDLLVVHIGAGKHNTKKDQEYYKLIDKSISMRGPDYTASFAGTSGCLEVSPLTNTGKGSSLNLLGEVTSDASFIHWNQKLIVQGAMHGIKSTRPMFCALDTFVKMQSWFKTQGYDKLGMTPPLIIDQSFRDMLLEKLGVAPSLVEFENPVNLITEEQQKRYDLYKDGFLDALEKTRPEVTDTVGTYYNDESTTILGASSGGNFLKMPSRIGCAAIIGAGIGMNSNDDYEISCMCSGSGEDIMLLNLSNLIITQLLNDIGTDIHKFLLKECEKIKLNIVVNGVPKLYVGLILVIHDKKKDFKRIVYYHTTESFYFGYRICLHKKVILSKNTGEFVLGEIKL